MFDVIENPACPKCGKNSVHMCLTVARIATVKSIKYCGDRFDYEIDGACDDNMLEAEFVCDNCGAVDLMMCFVDPFGDLVGDDETVEWRVTFPDMYACPTDPGYKDSSARQGYFVLADCKDEIRLPYPEKAEIEFWKRKEKR